MSINKIQVKMLIAQIQSKMEMTKIKIKCK
jgi:hypothetical protein